jgi:zinc D-Ala-D-Ala dipeptidase
MSRSYFDFLSLGDVIPGIHIQADYSTPFNFTGQIVPGYRTKKALLLKEPSLALLLVQKEAQSRGLSLKIFDGYRPIKAVTFFRQWALLSEDNFENKALYYPHLSRGELFNNGFLASESTHSRGVAVDLTFVEISSGLELDMGSRFDYFDCISNTDSPLITSFQRDNRYLLKQMMEKYGFSNFSKEWWHYTFTEIISSDAYDFDIE